MKTTWRAAMLVGAVLVFGGRASALINPNFTPLDLVRDSQTIVELEFKDVGKDGKAVATVKKVLKGTMDAKELTIDTRAMPKEYEAQGQMVVDKINGGQKQAVLFIGTFNPQGGPGAAGEGSGGPGAPGGTSQGYLHLGGKWIVLSSGADAKNWDMDKLWEFLLGTWSGGTDMLLRCVNYVQTDPDPSVPVEEGVSWAKEVQAAKKIEGTVVAAVPVDVEGKGKADLFVASDAGDQLIRLSGDKCENLTAKVKLTSKSQAFAWGDFNGDGRIDLASWDGKELTIYSQAADGTFAAKVVKLDQPLKDGCVALATLDYGNKGRPGLVVSTKAAPVFLMIQDDGSAKTKALVTGEFPGKDLGEGGRCLVADFDGDSRPDIVQLFTRGGLFYKGKGPAEFEAPVRTAACTRSAKYGCCVADLDQDGLPDIFIGSEQHHMLWQNVGGGKFVETLDISGEISYHPKPGVVAADSGAFANDGRQGVLIVYGSQMYPQLFYNRGFRSFAQAMKVDLAEQKLLPQAGDGQQAGCLGDFNGGGAVDMALVLKNGEAWIFPRATEGSPVLAAAVSLSTASSNAGPVNVQAWADKRALGSWTLRAGDPPAIISVSENRTPVTLKWQFPGGELQTREVKVQDHVVRVVLDKK